MLIAGGITVAVVLAAAWGPLPWSSRVAGRLGARLTGSHWLTLFLATIAPIVLTVTAVGARDEHRRVLVSSSVMLVALGVFVSTLAVRMWRFAPRQRAFDVVVLTATTLVAWVLLLPLTENGIPVAVGAAAVCAAAVALVAVPFARLNARVSSVPPAVHHMPRWHPGIESNAEFLPHEPKSTTSLGAAADRRLSPDGDQRRDDGCGPGQA